jgi:hypothetical protein
VDFRGLVADADRVCECPGADDYGDGSASVGDLVDGRWSFGDVLDAGYAVDTSARRDFGFPGLRICLFDVIGLRAIGPLRGACDNPLAGPLGWRPILRLRARSVHVCGNHLAGRRITNPHPLNAHQPRNAAVSQPLQQRAASRGVFYF